MAEVLQPPAVSDTQKSSADHKPRSRDDFESRYISSNGRKDVSAKMFYVKSADDGTKAGEGDYVSMKEAWLDPRDVVIHDASGLDLTLGQNGFQYFTQELPVTNYKDDESIKKVYYPAMERTIKEL